MLIEMTYIILPAGKDDDKMDDVETASCLAAVVAFAAFFFIFFSFLFCFLDVAADLGAAGEAFAAR